MLTLDQVAERFGVTRRTVESWVSEGRISVVRMSPRCVRIREADLEKVISRRTISAVALEPFRKGKAK